MSDSEPVTRGKEAAGKKAAAKGDPKIQPDEPSSQTDEQTTDTPATTANPPLPVQLAPNPLQLADLKFVPLPVAVPQFTTEDKPAVPARTDAVAGTEGGKEGEEIGGAGRDPNLSTPAAAPLLANLLAQPSVASGEESAKEGEEIGGAGRDPNPSTPAAVPLLANLLAQPSVAPGEEVSFTADVPEVVTVQVTVSQPQGAVPQRALAEAHKVTSTAPEEARPQFINTTARFFPRPSTSQIFPPLSPVPDAKLPPATEEAKVSRPGAPAENSSVETSSSAAATSATRPLPSEAATTEAAQLEPGAPLPPQRIEVSEAGQDKTKIGAPTLIANETRSAASSAAPAPEQLLAESPSANQTPRPATVEATLESKDGPEKKVSVSSPQSSLPPHETFAPAALTREPGTTVVVPAEAVSAPPAHAPSSETREVPKTQQMLDSAPAVANPPPAARIATEPGGEMQMHVGIRTTAFGAVEIYTSVHQNQVGLAVHGERGLAHWFSTEVQNIESGLKDHRLNLTTVELDSGSTGLQTATSSHHHHPQRNFSALRGSRNNVTLDRANETEPIEAALPGLPARSGETRVSIRI